MPRGFEPGRDGISAKMAQFRFRRHESDAGGAPKPHVIAARKRASGGEKPGNASKAGGGNPDKVDAPGHHEPPQVEQRSAMQGGTLTPGEPAQLAGTGRSDRIGGISEKAAIPGEGEFVESYAHLVQRVGGNSDLEQSKVIFLEETHNDRFHEGAIGDFIAENARSGDIVLTEAAYKDDDASVSRLHYVGLYGEVPPGVVVKGWEDRELDDRAVALSRELAQIGSRANIAELLDDSDAAEWRQRTTEKEAEFEALILGTRGHDLTGTIDEQERQEGIGRIFVIAGKRHYSADQALRAFLEERPYSAYDVETTEDMKRIVAADKEEEIRRASRIEVIVEDEVADFYEAVARDPRLHNAQLTFTRTEGDGEAHVSDDGGVSQISEGYAKVVIQGDNPVSIGAFKEIAARVTNERMAEEVTAETSRIEIPRPGGEIDHGIAEQDQPAENSALGVNLVRPQSLVNLVRGLATAAPDLEAITKAAKQDPKMHVPNDTVTGALAEIYTKVMLGKLAKELHMNVNFNPIPPGTTTDNFTFVRDRDGRFLANDTTNNNFADYDVFAEFVAEDGHVIPVVCEVKLDTSKRAGGTKKGLGKALSDATIRRLFEPLKEHYGSNQEFGYIVLGTSEKMKQYSNRIRTFTDNGGIVAPFPLSDWNMRLAALQFRFNGYITSASIG